MSAFDQEWEDLPKPENYGWRSRFGGQEWKCDGSGVYLKARSQVPLRSAGSPRTCQAIVDLYGAEIVEASRFHKVPPELIVMTIATEAAAHRASDFTGPPTFRWEAGISDYSAGPMQLLGSTARSLLKAKGVPEEWQSLSIPRYTTRPLAKPSVNPLYDAALSIWLGASYIALNRDIHGAELDPILVAACYNRGRLAQSTSNPWNLAVTNDHLDRAAGWYGDACAVLGALREGKDPPSVVTSHADGTPIRDGDDYFELYSLTPEQAEEEQAFYLESGANVTRFPQDDGLVTLAIDYPPTEAAEPDVPKLREPDHDGFVIYVKRSAVQQRNGKPFARTIGYYQAFYNREPIPGVAGVTVERQGPGDNTKNGDHRDRRIKSGTYPLSAHAGASGKYATYRYAVAGSAQHRPWPCLRVDGTKARTGILIHCAGGYAMTVGCINLAGDLPDASTNIDFADSRKRVIALIDSMKEHLGRKFPTRNNTKIEDALLVIEGEPT
jgi:peptidoglycan L-alanyl-D-glutamate endopeptidase CwlK